MLSYKMILEFCVTAFAQQEDHSEETLLNVINQFSSMPNWNREALIEDLRRHFSVLINDSAALVDEGHVRWLEARTPDIDKYYWGRYQKYLLQQGFAPNTVSEIDKSGDRVLGLMDDPLREGPWDRRGMVLGHVQSGKTAHYIGLVNKAADAGYKVIIVIAGIHNSLRNQTQRRLDEGFRGIASADIRKSAGHNAVGVGLINPERRPASFTTTLKDFNKAAAQQTGLDLANLNEPAVFVIKKNPSTLTSLIEWLRRYSGFGIQQQVDQPLLLIDDEADNASINTSRNPDRATRINSQIRELLSIFTRSSYVGYTATPFANIFVDPDTDDEMIGRDLFPRDFLVSLESPSNYFGPARIFDKSEPSPVLRYVEDVEEIIPASHKKTLIPRALPESLEEAIRTFLLTRAIKIARGKGTDHSSMLVNVSVFVDVQKRVEQQIHTYVTQIREQLELYGSRPLEQALKYPFIADLKSTFDTEFSNIEETWREIFPHLYNAVAPVSTRTINSSSADALDYEHSQEHGLHVIAIGGLSLSRGLTLEGLSTSYLNRNSKQYDTLMQMGRWFGYRPGYEDLCRIWLPEKVAGWYEHITDATEELRDEVINMQQVGGTPREFGLRVRSHPDTLLVTARNKMGSAERLSVKMSLTKTFIETARLSRKPGALSQNRDAARQLATRLTANDLIKRYAENGNEVFENVPVELVIDFLSRWENLEASYRTDPEKLVEFISARTDSLGLWDVAFPGLIKKDGNRESTLLPFPVTMQRRSLAKLCPQNELQITNKLRVMSPRDESIGLTPSELAQAGREAATQIKDQNQVLPGPIVRSVRSKPLMLVHLLNVTENDVILYDEPVVAWSISFPGATDPGEPVEYVVNRAFISEYLTPQDEFDEIEEDWA